MNTVLSKFLGCLKACLVPLHQSRQGCGPEKEKTPSSLKSTPSSLKSTPKGPRGGQGVVNRGAEGKTRRIMIINSESDRAAWRQGRADTDAPDADDEKGPSKFRPKGRSHGRGRGAVNAVSERSPAARNPPAKLTEALPLGGSGQRGSPSGGGGRQAGDRVAGGPADLPRREGTLPPQPQLQGQGTVRVQRTPI